jgi:hypothetical protein
MQRYNYFARTSTFFTAKYSPPIAETLNISIGKKKEPYRMLLEKVKGFAQKG